MKIKQQITETREVEVEFPLYMKYKNAAAYLYFKDDASQSIQVWMNWQINEGSTIQHYDMTNYDKCTKEEFNKAFGKCLETLKSKIE